MGILHPARARLWGIVFEMVAASALFAILLVLTALTRLLQEFY